ncbi:MAG: hypothetical protein HY537_07140 [Deltaproteobacteria bacterium]|nr:hypothetical protein [Deltaproteobacteria bacterium]
MLRVVLMVLLGVISSGAWAEDIEIAHMRTTRGCRGKIGGVITQGTHLSILFDNFNIDLDRGDRADRFAQFSECAMFFDLRLPQGYCAKGLRQSYQGGVVKSRHSHGFFHFRYGFGSVQAPMRSIRWRFGNEILPEDVDSLFTITRADSLRIRHCRRTIRYDLVLRLFGARSTIRNDFFQSGLDSIDTDFILDF